MKDKQNIRSILSDVIVIERVKEKTKKVDRLFVWTTIWKLKTSLIQKFILIKSLPGTSDNSKNV